MKIVYIVVETCSENADATAYKTREDAMRAIEHLSGQSREDWGFDDGTMYEGDNNYETTAQIIESKIYERVDEYVDNGQEEGE